MKKLLVLLVVLIVTTNVFAQKNFPNSYNYNRGVELVDNYEFDEGIKYLKWELEDNPKNGYAYVWMAVANYAKEEYSFALTEINKSLKLLPKKDKEYRAYAYAVRADLYYLLGETEKVVSDLSECIKLQPENTDYLEDRAQVYYEQEEYELSDNDYRKVSELDEGSVIGYMGLGRNAMMQKRYDDALKQFDYVVRMAGDYSSGYSFRAEAYMKKEEYNKAADDIVAALEIDGDEKAYFLMQEIAKSDKKIIEAKLKAKNLKDKSNPSWPFYLGVVNEKAKDYVKAIEYYKKALELQPMAYCAYRIYYCNEEMGNYPQALEYIDYAIEMDSTDADDLLMRADLLYYMGRNEECMQTVGKYIEHQPDFFFGYYRRGFYKDNTRDIEGAIEDYTMSIELAPGYAYAYLGRADMYALKGDKEASEADYRKVVEIDTIHNDGACAMYAYLELGELDEAKEFMQKVIDNNIDDAGVFYDATCLYSRMNEKEQALDYLRQAFEKGYHDFVHLDNDDDMDAIRDTEGFKALVNEYKEKCNWTVESSEKTFEEVTVEVPFTKDGDMCVVKCTINNLPLHFIFDTGASIISMSDVEATFMLKNGYLSSSDIIGKQHFLNADGNLSEGTVLNLRNVDFGGVKLENIQASVVKNQRAPLLLGQSVMQKLGRIEIDNERRVLKITYKKVVD